MTEHNPNTPTPAPANLLTNALLLLDAAGTITYASSLTAQILGCPPAQIVGKNLADVMGLTNSAPLRVQLAQAIGQPGTPVSLICQIQTANGSGISLETVVTSLLDHPGFSAIIVNLRDITARHQAETALKESEERFRTLFDLAPDAIFLAQTDTGIIVDANPAAAKLLNRPRQQIIGLHQSALHPPDQAELARQTFAYRPPNPRQDSPPVRIDVYCGDGSRKPVEIRGRKMTLRGHNYVLGIFRDLTELQQWEQKLQAILDHSPAIVYIKDLAGRYILMNHTCQQLAGLTTVEIKGKTTHELFPKEIADQFVVHDKLVLASSQPLLFEENIPHPDGPHTYLSVQFKIYDSQGQPEAICGISTDVTERKQADLILHQFQEIVSATPDAISLVDRDYVYRIVNLAYLRRTNLQLEQIVGHLVADVMGAETFEQTIKPNLDRCLAGEAIQYQAWFDFAGEGRRFIDVTYTPFRDNANAISGVLVSTRDITDAKQAEIALQASEAKNQAILRVIPDLMFVLTRTGQIMDFRASNTGDLVLEPSQVIGSMITDTMPPLISALILEKIDQALNSGQMQLFEFDLPVKRGPQYFEARLVVSGNTEVLAIVRNVTDRKQWEQQMTKALAEKEVLLRELYHRTKNNMQVIGSLMALQASKTQDQNLIHAFKDMENRIYAMALVHQKLYQSQDLSHIDLKDYIAELAELLTKSYQLNTHRVELVLDLEPISVLIDIAVPCGLILNELISNSIRHAFPDGRNGEIKIVLNKEDNRISLVISDNGVGLSPMFDITHSKTLGLQTVVGIGQHQLQGKVTLLTDHGLTCRVEFRDNLYRPRI